jgi:hypothetical protein
MVLILRMLKNHRMRLIATFDKRCSIAASTALALAPSLSPVLLQHRYRFKCFSDIGERGGIEKNSLQYDPINILKHADMPLLVLIGSLFVVMAGARLTGVADVIYEVNLISPGFSVLFPDFCP